MHDQLQFIDCLTDLVQGWEAGLLIVDKQFRIVPVAQDAIHLRQLLALPERVIEVILFGDKGTHIPTGSRSSLALEILVGAEDLLVLPAIAVVALALTRVLGLAALDVSVLLKGLFLVFGFDSGSILDGWTGDPN